MKNLNLFYSRHNVALRAAHIQKQITPYYELTVVLKGHLDYFVDGIHVPLDDGDAVFIRTGQTRERPASDDVCDYVSFNFEPQYDIDLPSLIKNAVHSEQLLLIAAFDKINSRFYQNNDEVIGHLLCCMLALTEERLKLQNFSPLTVSIISYVNKNYASRITLDDIAALTYFSPIYCDTVFRREVGRSIIDFLIEKRIEEAKGLLRGNVHKLSEISLLVGFNDYNYFSCAFKKRTGYSPMSYRKMMLKY